MKDHQIQELIEEAESDYAAYMEKQMDKKENLQTWKGSAEVDNEPDYEILKRHLEVWIKRNPKEMQEFIDYRKETIRNNLKATGASKSNNMRIAAAIPPGLFGIFSLLSPNFLGQKELTPDAQRKRTRKFLKHFPMFRMSEKS